MRRVALSLLALAVIAAPTFARPGATPPSAASADAPGITFFPNVMMPCGADKAGPFGCGQLVEPEVGSAPDGTIYVTAQEGVGGGVDIWKRDPATHRYVQMIKPDGVQTATRRSGFTLGGGDNDIAFSTDGKIYVTSLNLVTATLSTSTNQGKSWLMNPIANMEAGVDRQWIAATGENTVYMSYHDLTVLNVWLTKSTDGGLTFSRPKSMIPVAQMPHFTRTPVGIRGVTGAGNTTSDLVIDPAGRVGIAIIADSMENPTGENRSIYVSITAPGGRSPKVHQVYEGAAGENLRGLFPAMASDSAGNLYVAWSKNQRGIFLSKSTDHGVTWSAPVQISQAPSNFTVFPHLVAGSAGRVGAGWLGASTNDDNAEWHTYFAMNTDTLGNTADFTQVEASDHVVHQGAVCLGGLGCNASDPLGGGGRELAEVLQMGLTKDGRALIAYPDTSKTTSGWTFVAEQKEGPGLYEGRTTTPPADPTSDEGGPVTDPVTPTGTQTFHFAGGTAGTGIPAGGNQIDAPGGVGLLSASVPNEGHVASGSSVTTSLMGMPVTFESPALVADTIVGGTLDLTTYLQSPLGDAASGFIMVDLLDVAPDGSSQVIRTVPVSEVGAVTGLKKTRGNYDIAVDPWLVPAGHRLRIEIAFNFIGDAVQLFYYGKPAHLAGFSIGTFALA